MKSVVVISFLAVNSLAISHSDPELFVRQSSCPSGEKICGSGCIPTSYTCCPDESGGCPPTEYCGLADNGVYGCCPNGETCTGSATAVTDTYYDTSTYYPTVTTPTLTSVTATATSGGTVCETDWKNCGDGCIPESWTCCADQSGGCDPLIAKCFQGSDGNYGCCPNQYSSCTGPAGSPTTIPSDFTEPATPVSTTSRAIITSSATITSTTENVSSVTAVGTRSISSHTTAAQTSAATRTSAATQISLAVANQVAVQDPFAALFSALLAAAAFLVG